MLDAADDVRPPPAGVDLVQQSAGRIVEPRRRRRLGLKVVAFESRPSLQWIVMPRATGEVLVDVKIAVREDIEAGALLIADDDGDRILEFLAKTNVEHARVERPPPHRHIEPSRARKGSGRGARKDEVGRRGEHEASPGCRRAILTLFLDTTLTRPNNRVAFERRRRRQQTTLLSLCCSAWRRVICR